jgi:hypothetical protein
MLIAAGSTPLNFIVAALDIRLLLLSSNHRSDGENFPAQFVGKGDAQRGVGIMQ